MNNGASTSGSGSGTTILEAVRDVIGNIDTR
jgi:hypothetical protein